MNEVYFVQEDVVSLTADTGDNGTVEVSMTRRDGLAGASVLLDPDAVSAYHCFSTRLVSEKLTPTTLSSPLFPIDLSCSNTRITVFDGNIMLLLFLYNDVARGASVAAPAFRVGVRVFYT